MTDWITATPEETETTIVRFNIPLILLKSTFRFIKFWLFFYQISFKIEATLHGALYLLAFRALPWIFSRFNQQAPSVQETAMISHLSIHSNLACLP